MFRVCPEGFVCLMAGNNPNYGFTSYDSFGWSLLNMIRLLSQDFWENLLQMTLRSSGKFYLSFFLLVVFPSCFCILCLMVAAVVMACVKREEVGATEAREREEEFREVLETLKRTEDEEQASCGMALSQGQDRHNNQHQGHTAGTGTCSDVLLKWECCGCWRWLHQRLHTVITNPFFDLAIIVCIIVDILFMSMEHYPMTEEFAVHLSIADLVSVQKGLQQL
ncbi:sodium channel protein type 4 subunit alpha A-like [Plectropomus leopardus]|uniref:sodium channel protein type 4 subunit alpha A-like n=1 Tax=Plectropomus leopardus TaxID=160734 RepID=UPI001C4ACD15|nr:sodium channel protein type 4 subunit alpha A-like [Plectropomus leopardus]